MTWDEMRQACVNLTPRELRVLGHLAEGLTTKAIAKEVFLAEKTVEHMLGKKDKDRGLYHKLNVPNRAAAAAWFTETQTAEQMLTHYSRSTLTMVHRTRLNGSTQQAGDDAAEAIAFLKRKMEQQRWDVKQFVPLAKEVAALMREQLVAHFERLLPGEIELKTRPLIKELHDLAKALDAPALHAVADYALGMLYYLTKQRDRSIKALERALPTTPEVDQQLTILRLLALNWAFLDEEKAFVKTMRQGQALIEQGHFSELQLVSMALEGFGRGQGVLKKTAAFDTLARAWQIYEQAKTQAQRIPLRFIQLARSELEVMVCLKENDSQILTAHGQMGLEMAQELGYPRYARQIYNHLAGLH